jgi:hypothetical protein
MDQLHSLLERLDWFYGNLAGVFNAAAGLLMVWLLAMALYRYFAGNQKLAALYEDVLAAAGAGLCLGFAAGVLNGSLYPANVFPYQLGGVLLSLVVLRYLRK